MRASFLTHLPSVCAGFLLLTLVGCSSSSDTNLTQWTSTNPSEPGAANWDPILLASASAIRVASPPTAASGTTAADLAEVRLAVANATEAEIALVRKWNVPNQSANYRQLLDILILNARVGVPSMARIYAALGVAINDATLASWNNQYHYLRPRPEQLDARIVPPVATPQNPAYPADRAAVAGAAERILTYFFPAQSAEITALADEAIEAQINGGLNLRGDLVAGRELGKNVADLVIERLEADGRSATYLDHVFAPKSPALVPSAEVFFANLPGARSAQVYDDNTPWSEPNPMDPLAGTWVPMVMSSAAAMTVAAPPANTAAETLACMDEINTSLADRTFYTDFVVYKYANDPPGIFFVRALDEQLAHRDWSAPRNARATAIMAAAIYDGLLACWHEKYRILKPRPYHLDPGMPTIIPTPPHPAYPSGHATCGGVGLEILTTLFPDNESEYRYIFDENNHARVWAGVHFRYDMDAGNLLGAQAAADVLTRVGWPAAE